jgi:glutamate racemase
MTGPGGDAPIGVFDSGVGGLSVLKAIRRELPHEDLIYVADSANAPYGDQAPGFIAERTDLIARFLVASHAKAIVVACNTATVVAIDQLRAWCPVPVIAMEPAIKPAAMGTKSGVVGVLATSRTVASASVARLCSQYGANAKILLQPCPGLVECVERGELSSPATRALLSRYVAPLLEAGVDRLVVGCTHYSFLAALIGDIAGPNVEIVDPAVSVARELARRLGANRRPAARASPPGERFFTTSGQTAAAQSIMSALWGASVAVHGFDAPGANVAGQES